MTLVKAQWQKEQQSFRDQIIMGVERDGTGEPALAPSQVVREEQDWICAVVNPATNHTSTLLVS